MAEHRYFLNVEGDSLYVMLHEPRDHVRGNIVFCNPIFEERKSAHRTMVETALFLCQHGYRVGRFDYRGCGDSSGNFEDFTVKHWLKDIESVFTHIRSINPTLPTAFLGLRFGATLALQSGTLNHVDYLILWEPVVNGMKYIQEELKRAQVKEMMTWGHSATTREAMLNQIQTRAFFDLSGYMLSKQLFDDICKISLQEFIIKFTGKLLLVSISHAKTIGSIQSELSAISAEKQKCYTKKVVLPPFWNLISYVDCSKLISETVDWLKIINSGRAESE